MPTSRTFADLIALAKADDALSDAGAAMSLPT